MTQRLRRTGDSGPFARHRPKQRSELRRSSHPARTRARDT
jgi:hypothetical protein